jgi:hypothetical protein
MRRSGDSQSGIVGSGRPTASGKYQASSSGRFRFGFRPRNVAAYRAGGGSPRFGSD